MLGFCGLIKRWWNEVLDKVELDEDGRKIKATCPVYIPTWEFRSCQDISTSLSQCFIFSTNQYQMSIYTIVNWNEIFFLI